MKKIFVILSLLAMAVVGTQDMSAQKWLKKIGKIAEEVLLTPGSSTSTSNSSAKSSKAQATARAEATGIGNSTLANNVPGLDITLRTVERLNSTTVKINMIFMNTTSKDIKLVRLPVTNGIYTTDGDQLTSARLFVGSKETSISNYSNEYFSFPSNVPVKVAIEVSDCPASTFTFAMIKLLPGDANLYDSTYPIEIRNLTIPEQAAKSFKGNWNEESKSDGYVVYTGMDLNLYAKVIENDEGEYSYGLVMRCNEMGRIYFTIIINSVESINGNIAKVNCTEQRSGTSFKATLTYNPGDGSMTYSDSGTSFTLPKAKN